MKQPPNLTQLQHKLRKGYSPKDWSLQKIGEGAQKSAYRIDFETVKFPTGDYTKPVRTIDSFIVKENTGGYRDDSKAPPKLQSFGCDTIYQIKAGNWIIQEMAVKILADLPASHGAWRAFKRIRYAGFNLDLHAHNFGVRNDGSLICFDW